MVNNIGMNLHGVATKTDKDTSENNEEYTSDGGGSIAGTTEKMKSKKKG